MFSQMRNSDKLFCDNMLMKINTEAKNIFDEAINNMYIYRAYLYENKYNNGVFINIVKENLLSVLLSFDRDLAEFKDFIFIEKEIKKNIQLEKPKAVFIKVNAYNPVLINFLTDIGFIKDALGFELFITKSFTTAKLLVEFKLNNELALKGFEDEKAFSYLQLIDDAFRKQNIECNEQKDMHIKYPHSAMTTLKKASQKKDFWSFWQGDSLVGLCVLNGAYVETIAVSPRFENRGYGSQIVKYCIYDRLYLNSFEEMYLHTYFQNRKAQRLYLKNGLAIRGFYYEASYKII